MRFDFRVLGFGVYGIIPNPKPYLDPKEPTFLGFLVTFSLHESIKSRFFRVQVDPKP